jgi:hypothetical protein
MILFLLKIRRLKSLEGIHFHLIPFHLNNLIFQLNIFIKKSENSTNDKNNNFTNLCFESIKYLQKIIFLNPYLFSSLDFNYFTDIINWILISFNKILFKSKENNNSEQIILFLKWLISILIQNNLLSNLFIDKNLFQKFISFYPMINFFENSEVVLQHLNLFCILIIISMIKTNNKILESNPEQRKLNILLKITLPNLLYHLPHPKNIKYLGEINATRNWANNMLSIIIQFIYQQKNFNSLMKSLNEDSNNFILLNKNMKNIQQYAMKEFKILVTLLYGIQDEEEKDDIPKSQKVVIAEIVMAEHNIQFENPILYCSRNKGG